MSFIPLRANIYLFGNKRKEFMNMIEIASAPAVPRNDEQKKLNWLDSLPIQHLLDVISSILAEEYISIAKQNPEVFSEIASRPLAARNDYSSDHNDGRQK